jgi:hypothetical protein
MPIRARLLCAHAGGARGSHDCWTQSDSAGDFECRYTEWQGREGSELPINTVGLDVLTRLRVSAGRSLPRRKHGRSTSKSTTTVAHRNICARGRLSYRPHSNARPVLLYHSFTLSRISKPLTAIISISVTIIICTTQHGICIFEIENPLGVD